MVRAGSLSAAARVWSLPAILFAAYAVAFVDRALVAVAGAPIMRDLALSDTQFGLLSGTAFAVLFSLCGIPLGWLADRTDRRMIIAAGLVVWSAMTALSGLAHSFGALALARIGVGLGEASLLPAGMSLLRSRMPTALMGRSVAIFLMGGAFGAALAHIVGGVYLLYFEAYAPPGPAQSWRTLFVLAGLPGLFVAALIMTVPEPSRAARAPLRQLRGAVGQLWAGRHAYGFLTAATACTVALTQAQAAWLPLFYVRSFGLTPGHSALMVGAMFVVSVPLGQWAGGVLIDRLYVRGVIAPPNTVLACCAALSLPAAALFCTTGSLRLSQAAYMVFSFLASAATPSGLVGWQVLTPERHVGMVVAILVSVVTLIGVGLGPAAIGFLTDRVFQDQRAIGSAMLILFATTAALGSCLALAGRRAFQANIARAP